MPSFEHVRPPARIRRHVTLLLAGILAAAIPASAAALQDSNPYGRIDPVTASASVLRRAVGDPGNVSALANLDRFDPDGITELLELTLDHPSPAMRTIAGVALVQRGSNPATIAGRMGSPEATDALVIGMLGAGCLDPDDAILLVDDAVPMPPVAMAISRSLAGRPVDQEALATILADEDAPSLAHGIAAAALESTRPGTVETWLASTDADDRLGPDRRDRIVFETIEASRRLGLIPGISAIETSIRDRPSNDGLRAATVLTLLEKAPSTGITAWKALASPNDDSISGIPICMLLVGTGTEAPAEAGDMIPTADPLQSSLRDLVFASPAERPRVAEAAVRRGHLPTIRWFLELPDDQMSIDTLDAILARGTTNRRPAMAKSMVEAAAAMGRLDPDRLLPRLEAAEAKRDLALSEILLRGLIDAGTESAAKVANGLLDAPRRGTRSMALLAIVNGSSSEEISVGSLGRIAAGGGDLPQDLRPLAAWHHLRLSGSLDESLPEILAP